MRNPFKRKAVPIDNLLSLLFAEIDELAVMIEELRKDLQDLTDFVEDNLD
jgi:NTP pyrophosphatase (non-canonical NTP hydrolase)